MPTPTRLKLLRGNPGHRPIGDEPRPKVKVPRCPPGLDAAAAAEWRRVGRELAKLSLVSEIDRAALAGYCTAWSDFKRAREHLQDDADFIQTSVKMTDSPSVWKRLSDDALKQIRQFCSEFGLSPAARVRLATVKPKQGDDDDAFRDGSAGG